MCLLIKKVGNSRPNITTTNQPKGISLKYCGLQIGVTRADFWTWIDPIRDIRRVLILARGSDIGFGDAPERFNDNNKC